MVGANNYYFAFSGANGQARLLDLVCQAGLNVLRIWAFNDFKPVRGGAIPADTDVCFQFMRPGRERPELRDGPVGLERLDRAVKLAGERRIRLILTLTNYWPDYGGMPQYREWLGLPDVNDFYRDARAKSTFQNWVHALMTRQESADWPLILRGPHNSGLGNCERAAVDGQDRRHRPVDGVVAGDERVRSGVRTEPIDCGR